MRYLGSQPWPFPQSIMLGFTARADVAAPLHPAEGEIEQAVWATRVELQAGFRAAHAGDFDPVPIAGGAPELVPPTSSSIARLMLQAWAFAQP